MGEPGRAFESGVAAWERVVTRPRNTVRQRLVADQLAALVAELVADGVDRTGEPGGADGPGRSGGSGRTLRVLDAGCGQGTQALGLARAGHRVTGLDPSDELLDRFRATLDAEPAAVRERVRLVRGPGEHAPALAGGRFDLVLCHGVLMYLDDPAPMLDALGAVAAPGAGLSLLVRNGLAPAMRPGLRGESRAALDAFDRLDYTNGIGLAARMHTPDELDGLLAARGWRPRGWYGVRVFSDHRDGPEPGDLDDLVAAEAEAGRRDPYRRVAALLHLHYRA